MLAAGVAVVLIASGATTLNVAELLVPPPGTVTTTETGPCANPEGTSAEMDVLVHDPMTALIPPNVTELVPCVPPKFVPAIVTEVPTGPAVGAREVIVGVVVTGDRTSTMLRLKASAVGAVSLTVTLVPAAAIEFVTCCVHSVSGNTFNP